MNEELEAAIFLVQGQRVILDSDLAILYGVTTKRLNEQVKRNIERFPRDFMFPLQNHEFMALRSQFATSKKGRGGRRYVHLAFTEHGAVMAANVLSSKVAINASIVLVRTFIKMRMLLAEHLELKKRLDEIERRIAKDFANHEQELQEIRFLIAELEKPVVTKKVRIGF